MKIWTPEERLKSIKHAADSAKTESRRLVARGLLPEAVELLKEALGCIQAFATASDARLDDEKKRLARFL